MSQKQGVISIESDLIDFHYHLEVMKRGNLDSVDVHVDLRSNTSSDEERQ